MKWILAFILIPALLASGCTETGQITGGGEEAEAVCSIVNESYVDIDNLDARVLGVNKEIKWSGDLGYYAEGSVSLENTDNESGWFVLAFNWLKPREGMPYTQKLSRHLNPGDIWEFKSICPDIDPQYGVSFVYEYESYPDSQRIVKKEREIKICD